LSSDLPVQNHEIRRPDISVVAAAVFLTVPMFTGFLAASAFREFHVITALPRE